MTQQTYAMLSREEARRMVNRQILLENGVIEGQMTYMSPADLLVYTKMADGRYKPFADVMREPEHRITDAEITGLELEISKVPVRNIRDLASPVPGMRKSVGDLVYA